MKLIMENWRKFKNEMRDRYYAPGEAPGDPSLEDEMEMDRLDQAADEIAMEAENNPKQVIDITQGGHYLVYDDGGEQYFTFDSAEDADLAIRSNFKDVNNLDIFYVRDRNHMDNMQEFLIKTIKQHEQSQGDFF